MSALTDLQHLAARAADGQIQSMRDENRDLRMNLDAIRHAAVLVLFGSDGKGIEAAPEDCDVLLVERAATLEDHPGQVGFPGGGLEESDADEVAAALREAVEETGLDPAGVQILGVLPATGLPVSNFMVTPVLAWWAAPSEVFAVDLSESARVFRAPLRDLLNPELRRTTTVTRGSETFRSPAFLVHDTVVWGFTGGVLNKLFNELGWTRNWDSGREMPAPV